MNEQLWNLEQVTLGCRLRDVTLAIPAGVTAVLGPSGAGKTTLLNLLVGFERCEAGTVTASFSRGAHARPFFWAPQDDGLWPHLSVRRHLEAMQAPEPDALLAEFDLSERAGALPHTLSRGERARLSVARALAADAAVLVMDEPLAHVDPSAVTKYWDALRRHRGGSGGSLVFATHTPGAVLAEAQSVICLRDGRVAYSGAVAELYAAPPTAELARCLGEANWLEPAAARLWLRREERSPRCFRPERIAVIPADGTGFVVQSARFCGAVARVGLRHEATGAERVFWHRPSGNDLSPGMRVTLEVK